MARVLHDKAIIGLLALIIEKRMFIIDDKEFVSEKQNLNSAFLTLNQVKFVALLMNRIAYELFEQEGNEAVYG